MKVQFGILLVKPDPEILGPGELAALESISAAVWVWDSRIGRIVWANTAGVRLWGAPNGEALTALALDHAMPALRVLRTIDASVARTASVHDLTFWAGRGVLAVRCRVRPLERGEYAGALLVEVIAGDDRKADSREGGNGSGESARAGQQICPDGSGAQPPPRASEQDLRKMAEIGEKIRAAVGRGAGSVDDGTNRAKPAKGKAGRSGGAAVDGPAGTDGTEAETGAGNPHGDILARIGHEVRTPLSSIIGFAELMKDAQFGPIANPRYEGYIGDILASARHALSLVNDLLDYSRARSERSELAPALLDLGDVAADALSAMQPLAMQRNVGLVGDFDPGGPTVLADRRSLLQILFNLLSNAIKFTPAGGDVRLNIEPGDDGGLEVIVADTGPGMSKRELARALEPFIRLEATEGSSEGSGLGLPLTKAIAESLGAGLVLESRPKHGTRARVIFPPERVGEPSSR